MMKWYYRVMCFMLLAAPARAGLTIDDVAAAAYAAGFRGGSLVSAVAAADAESALDPNAVANNVVLVDAAGNVIPGRDGQPQTDVIPTTGQVMLPINSIHNLSGGRRGKVASHCRGLWQFNNSIFPQKPTDAQAFDVHAAAACAWIISRHGRDWGKWRVMRNGRAFEEPRLTAARKAASKVDNTVIVNGTRRIEGRVTAGCIRNEPAGKEVLRRFHRGDSGWLTGGPELMQITQGPQTSWKLWWRAEWDTGEVGWVSEDLLIASSTPERQPASPVSEGAPSSEFHIPRRPVLWWTIGANTIRHRVYLSTDPALPPSSLKWEGRSDQWTSPTDLPWRTRHWWRVDSLGSDDNWQAGPVYTFCTTPPPVGYFTISSLTVTPAGPVQPGCRLQISGTAFCEERQPVLVGVSLIKSGVTLNDPIHDVVAVIDGTTAFSRVFDIPWTATTGTWTVRVALWQDGDENGSLGSADRVLAEMSRTIFLTDPLPKIMPISVTPAQMAPGAQATISAQAFAVPGSTITTARLFRGEGNTLPAPGSWTFVGTRTLSPAIGNAGGTITFTDRPPSIRRYWYAINATDDAGRTGPIGITMWQPGSVLVTINDTTPPVITWITPADGQVTNGGIPAQGSVSDNDIVEKFEYSSDGGPWQTWSTGSNWTLSLASGTGAHSLSVRATDRSGNAATSTRIYYLPWSTSLDFDENVDFAGDTAPPHWGRTFQQPEPDTAGFADGRVFASGETARATVDAFKRPPGGTYGVEAGFLCGPEGVSLTWDRLFWNPIVVKIEHTSAAQWHLHTGENNNPQITPLTIPGGIAPESITVFLTMTDGRLYVRAGRGAWPYEIFGTATFTSPQLHPTDLQNCRFELTGTAAGMTWLDNLSFRALRQPSDTFAIRSAGFTGGATPRFNLEWMSFPGRTYVVEINDTGTWRTHTGEFTSSGLLHSTNAAGPASGLRRAQARVRQVVP